ncbi:MBL fold metallo-hydrolase [Streptomyces sulfonofaciens]|uniref:MBL fold metallo-hydrolase n=1 Tax=Streptomyces sulfonofaciens TaxID=68272 RepID=A0A919GHU5_9ACTN|nr:MBL fold metallo-hydrolase [Streptomyces sulfonofaciens]GHH85057.1 MBL fold metallo-hydrolase [Streptomyces sulfonofaciens]
MNAQQDTGRGIRIESVGGPTAILEIGGVRLITDPTFDEPQEYDLGPGRLLAKTAASALGPDDVGPVDAVLLSHDQHVDNLDVSGRAYLARVPLVLTTLSATERLSGACQAVDLWKHVDLRRPDGDVLRVTRVPALHGPAGTEHLVGEVAGFVLSGEGVPTVYVSGDNASLDVVRAVAERFERIDVAVLFAGAARIGLIDGFLTLTGRQAAQAARILSAPHVVPVHFDMWGHFTEGAPELAGAFAEAGLGSRLTLLAPGESTVVADAQED